MEISPPPPPPPPLPPPPPPPPSKPDRKTIEKNRRNQMKFLYSKLDSLVTSSLSTSIPLPDLLDEATNYIKRVQERIEQLKEKKRELIGSSEGTSNERRSPLIEVHDLGSGLNSALIISSDHDSAMIHKSIRAIEEGGVEVLNAHYSAHVGDKAILSVHTLVKDSNEAGSAARSTLNRLKKAF